MKALLAALALWGCAAPPARTPRPDAFGETTGLFLDGATQAYRALARGKSEKSARAAALDELGVLADCHAERLEEEYRALTGSGRDRPMSEPDVCGVRYPAQAARGEPGSGPLARKVGKLAALPEAWYDADRGDYVARAEVTRAALDGALVDDESLSPKLRVFVHAQAVKAWGEEKVYLERGL